MNRDEKRSRSKGLPPVVRLINARRVLCPSEPNGGTWVALNEARVSFALINWYSVAAKAERDVISRGTIIPTVGASDSATLADARLSALPLDRFNPFRLIGVFPNSREICEWRWNLRLLSRKRLPWRAQQWISSGFDERSAQKVRSTTFKKALDQKTAGSLRWLRRLHRSHAPRSGPFSICMHREDSVTVSYTEICLGPNRMTMKHINSAGCSIPAEYCQDYANVFRKGIAVHRFGRRQGQVWLPIALRPSTPLNLPGFR
jgi:hypothetical protein